MYKQKPEVKLGKYKGIELEKGDVSVVAADVKKELDQMAEKNARLVTVEDRAVKNKDIAVTSYYTVYFLPVSTTILERTCSPFRFFVSFSPSLVKNLQAAPRRSASVIDFSPHFSSSLELRYSC